MSERKEIHSEDDRACSPHDQAAMNNEEAFAKDYTRECEVCGAKPVVNAVCLCGPCTWGESETAGGNW